MPRTTLTHDADLHAAAQQALGRALLVRTAALLRDGGVFAVVPLKGVLLSALADDNAPPRPMLDVDVLVSEHELERAERALVAAGMRVRERGDGTVTLHDPDVCMDLDLHGRLFQRGMFRMDTAGVLARGRDDDALFGVRVRRPHDLDLYAHLVGHFVRNRSTRGDRRRLADLAFIAERLGLDPSEVARHLEQVGMRRAARYALGIAGAEGDEFARTVLVKLRRDRVGDAIVPVARAALARFPGNHPLGAIPSHLLNHTLAAGSRSLAIHLARGARRRVAERLDHRRH